MLRVTENRDALAEWRNRPMNPFREPPFQLLWIANDETNLFAFRAHHAVVDGEAFFEVCVEAVRALAGKKQPRITRILKTDLLRAVNIKDACRRCSSCGGRHSQIAVRVSRFAATHLGRSRSLKEIWTEGK